MRRLALGITSKISRNRIRLEWRNNSQPLWMWIARKNVELYSNKIIIAWKKMRFFSASASSNLDLFFGEYFSYCLFEIHLFLYLMLVWISWSFSKSWILALTPLNSNVSLLQVSRLNSTWSCFSIYKRFFHRRIKKNLPDV